MPAASQAPASGPPGMGRECAELHWGPGSARGWRRVGRPTGGSPRHWPGVSATSPSIPSLGGPSKADLAHSRTNPCVCFDHWVRSQIHSVQTLHTCCMPGLGHGGREPSASLPPSPPDITGRLLGAERRAARQGLPGSRSSKLRSSRGNLGGLRHVQRPWGRKESSCGPSKVSWERVRSQGSQAWQPRGSRICPFLAPFQCLSCHRPTLGLAKPQPP